MEKITQIWRDVLAEIYSWSRWICFNLLPLWLSYPFQFAAIKTLYFLALIALIVVYIPAGPLLAFAQSSLVDLWQNLVGENSAKALTVLLRSFPAQWVLLSIAVLLFWGAIVFLWAGKQQRFFQSITEAGLSIVRGPGRRMAFFERLQKGGVSGLGLGPTARLLPVYIPRKEDDFLRERMRAYLAERVNFGVLVSGVATSGKTRTAMELIFDLRPAFVLVWPRGLSASAGMNFPAWAGSAILLADNLALTASEGDVPLPPVMGQLLLQCSRLVLVGTIRRNILPKDLRRLEAVELTEIEENDPALGPFASYLAEAEKKQKSSGSSAEIIVRRYNGHPAGLVAGMDAMREIYGQLDGDWRNILRAAKLLRGLGIQRLTLERMMDAAGVIAAKQYPESEFRDALDELSETGLLVLVVGKAEPKILAEVYECYLDNVIELPVEAAHFEAALYTGWRQRQDGGAFVDRGDSSTELYNPDYQANPRQVLRAGISFYREALRFHTEERAPLDYARTQNNLGIAYISLARYEEPSENLKRAIQAYGEALRFHTEERAPLDYAMTQNNLGVAYGDLAKYEEPSGNLKWAIQAYGEALRYRTEQNASLQYAMTQNNLGIAYISLARYEEPSENLKRAIQAYGEALRFYTEEHAPLDYAMTQNNLGNAYDGLAWYEEPSENLKRAIQAYGEALRYRTEERAPLDYAMTQNNLGNAYGDLAGYEEPSENLKRAIQAYGEALRYLTEERAPLGHARTQNNLGATYGDLAKYEESSENLKRAIRAYGEALRYRTEENAPLQYAMTQNNLGIAYRQLAESEEPSENLERAIRAYGEALRFYTEEHAPLDYARTQNNLGTAYGDLAKYEEPSENLERAIQAYGEALRYRTEEHAPLDYARTQNNLGTAYGDLAKYEELSENLERAIQAYGEALRYLTEERAPLDYAMTQNNLGAVYGDLAKYEEPSENLKRAILAYGEALRYFTEEHAPLDYARTKNNLANSYERYANWFRLEKRFEEAISSFEQAHKLKPGVTNVLNLAGTYRQMGKMDLFVEWLEQARQLANKDDWYNLACIESLAGDLEAGIENLRQAAAQEKFDRAWAWEDPDLEFLRGDKRFEEIVGPRANA